MENLKADPQIISNGSRMEKITAGGMEVYLQITSMVMRDLPLPRKEKKQTHTL